MSQKMKHDGYVHNLENGYLNAINGSEKEDVI